jgi:hypothetical protein
MIPMKVEINMAANALLHTLIDAEVRVVRQIPFRKRQSPVPFSIIPSNFLSGNRRLIEN